MLSTCAKLLQSLRYFGFHFTQAPHTYSVSQPLPSHVSLSRNRHRKIVEMDVHTHGLEISMLLCCQPVPNGFNHWGILDSTLHRHPTHILSPNHCHRMCLGQGIGTEKSLKLTFIHKGSRCHCFYAVNLCQTASMIDMWDSICIRKTSIFTLYKYVYWNLEFFNFNTVCMRLVYIYP